MNTSEHTDRLKRRISRLEKQISSYREKLKEANAQAHLLLKSNKQLESLVNEFPGYLALIQDGKILLTNNKILSDLGYNKSEVNGHAFDGFIHKDSLDFVREIYRKRLKNQAAPDVYELKLLSKRGQGVPCEARVARVKYDGRRAFLVSLTPLKERQDSEADRRKKEKLRLVSRFSKGMAHQLQICASLLANCMEQRANEKGEKVYEKLLRAKKHQEELINTLGLLNNMEQGQQSTVSLVSLVEQAQEFARKMSLKFLPGSEQSVGFRTFIRASTYVRANASNLTQAIGHILANAVEASSPEGTILITVEHTPGLAHIYVQDNGPGIPLEEQEKIFEPFYTTKPHHLGLGLSLAAAVLNGHGGRIDVTSHLDHGTIFSLTLPAVERTASKKPLPPGKVLKNSRVMMLGEDDTAMGLISQILKDKGATITFPSNPTKALKQLSKAKIDILIIHLDELLGRSISFVKEAAYSVPDLPIICLAPIHGKAIRDTQLAELSQNVTLLRLPLNIDELLQTVTLLLSSPSH